MYQIIVEYTTGNSFGRDDTVEKCVLHTCSALGEANLIAALFADYAQLDDSAFGNQKENEQRKSAIITSLLKLNVQLNSFWQNAINNSGFGYFDEIKRIYVQRDTPECFEWIA